MGEGRYTIQRDRNRTKLAYYMKHTESKDHNQIITTVRKVPEMCEMGHIFNALDDVFIQVQLFDQRCLNPFDALNFVLPQNQIL